MTNVQTQVSDPEDRERMRRNLRLAFWLGLLAVTFYVSFFFAVSNRG